MKHRDQRDLLEELDQASLYMHCLWENHSVTITPEQRDQLSRYIAQVKDMYDNVNRMVIAAK